MRPLLLPSRLQQSSHSIPKYKSKMADSYTLPRHRPSLRSTYRYVEDKDNITGDRMVRCQRGGITRVGFGVDFKSKRKEKEKIYGDVPYLPPDIDLGLSSESDTESETSFSPPIFIPSDVSFALSSLADFLSPIDSPVSLINQKEQKDSPLKGCLQTPGLLSKGFEMRVGWAEPMEPKLEADSAGNVPATRFIPGATSITSIGWLPLFLSFFFKQSQHRSKPPRPSPAPNIPLHILLLLLGIISTLARRIKGAVLRGVKLWVVMEVVWHILESGV